MTQDLNKNICGIEYNLLNLPTKVSFSDGSIITYAYSANGDKLSADYNLSLMNVMNGTTGSAQASSGVKLHRDYCGNFIYEDGALKMMLIDGGYVTFGKEDYSNPKFHFYLKDHLGNNRVVADAKGTIEQVNHYYPFGTLMAESKGDVLSYKYNGKELDRMHGLDSYDYGARWMADGRFSTPDPHATDYTSVSPYAYCENNPINAIDLNGEDNYEINSLGYIFLTKKTNDAQDVLYFGKKNISLGKGLLKQLTMRRNNYNGNYAISSNFKDIAKLFVFAANNTNVEWGIDAFFIKGRNSYNIRTIHDENKLDPLNTYNDRYIRYTVHSHSKKSNSHQASGPDVSHIKPGETIEGYYDFGDVGRYGAMVKTYQTAHNVWTYDKFPKAYIYDAGGKTSPYLFQYTDRRKRFNSVKIYNLNSFLKHLKP